MAADQRYRCKAGHQRTKAGVVDLLQDKDSRCISRPILGPEEIGLNIPESILALVGYHVMAFGMRDVLYYTGLRLWSQ